MRDVYRIPLWLLQKPLYSVAPISLHFRLATLRGTTHSLTSRNREKVMEMLERHLGETTTTAELRDIRRRFFQTRARRRVIQTWPEIRNFTGVESIPIEGLDHLDAALERKRGAILATAHFGHMNMIKPIVRSHGRPALKVAVRSDERAPRRTRVGSFVFTTLLDLPEGPPSKEWQESSGTDLEAGFDVRPLVEALERNEAVIILVDGHTAQAVHRIEVAGIKISFAPGAVSIARSTGAAMLPTFAVSRPRPTGPADMRLLIDAPLELQATDDHQADVETNLRRFAKAYERRIRAYPHNFFWSWIRDGVFRPRSR
jgi:lauroyl/myristoyl acyltransferase